MPLTLQQQLALAKLGASASGNTDLGAGLGDVSAGLGAYRGLESGTTAGDISGAADIAKLASSNIPGAGTSALGSLGASKGVVGDVGTGATGALDALAVYEGLRRGGFQGYGQAAGAGLQGAGLLLGNAGLQTAGGAILAPLETYNAIKNWQSGNTGSDALQGAEAGAAWGSLFGPEGTLIGGVIGGAAGALSSAFGGGERDPETTNWNTYATAANKDPAIAEYLPASAAYQNLAGVMDAKNNAPGHSQPIEQVFGRMGEGNLMDQMTNYINQQAAAGNIKPGESVQDQWTKTIDPWLVSKGAPILNQRTSSGTPEGQALTGDLQNLISSWEGNALTSKTPVGISGQTISGLPNWLGSIGNVGPQVNPGIQSTGPSPTNKTPLPANWQVRPSPVGPSIASLSTPAPAGSPMMQANSFGLTSVAEGGHMKKRKSGLDALWEMYAGPHFSERQNFDDGGDVSYVGNYDPSSGTTDLSSLGASYSSTPTAGSSYEGDIASLQEAAKTNPTIAQYLKDMGITSTIPASSSSGTTSGHTVSGDLQTALKNLTGGSGLLGITKSIGALSPLAALLMRPRTNLTRPQGVPGMTAGATPPKAPTFNRTQNMTPSNLPGGAPMSLQDWYTYGSRPEASFFNNNQLNMTQATGVGHAKGGKSALDSLGGDHGMPEFDSAIENHAMGPGDGTSDNIPAQLSDGEYVMDANTVSMLGNGSNKAGAERLDQLRENLRKHAAKPMAKGKQFMKAKPPEAYMGKGRR